MQGGDLRQNFEEAFGEYLEPIFRYFYYRLNDRDRAMDLAQETFMRAWDYARKGNEIASIKPFLYTTANNIFKNELRAKKAVVSLEVLMDLGFEMPDEQISIEEKTEAGLLMQKLPLLSPSYHEVLTLRFIDGLSPQEIGEALNERSATISVRIHRGLRKLRELHDHHEKQ